MKKIVSLVIVIATICTLAGCGKESPTDKSNPTTTTKAIEQLQAGDEVSIVGQVVSSTLVNGNMLWVQVQQDDGSSVIYYCQLKDEFITEAETPEALSVVNVKGSFLSKIDVEQEDTAVIVTLYDCEIK